PASEALAPACPVEEGCGSFQVSVWPETSVVEYGGSVWINCSTSCQDPNAAVGLETSLTKAQNETKRGTGWVAFRLVDIMEWESALMCFFNCRGLHKMVSAKVSVYRKCLWPRLQWGELGFCATESLLQVNT
uniref:Intercellular adhesion molecule N-terminal domain-containing protein n=1 Tax=Pelusios castaneus TaxID=367368 RepID=A0A8C8RJE2_9SAUR